VRFIDADTRVSIGKGRVLDMRAEIGIVDVLSPAQTCQK
jgi:hypothetical protein